MEYRILHYLQGIADYDNIAQTSQVFLAQQLETTEATISVSLKRLDELGVVKKIPYHGRTAFEISQKISTRGKVK
jgi:Mn-dependent DtxR family transcriptional regulator